MSININSGFALGAATPIDDRLVLTKEQMLNIDENVYPSVYLCVCADDGLMYTFNKDNESNDITGKFRVSSGDSTVYLETLDEYQALVDAGIVDPNTEYIISGNAVGALLSADKVTYNGTTSGLTATTVQEAVDELKTLVDGSSANIEQAITEAISAEAEARNQAIADAATEVKTITTYANKEYVSPKFADMTPELVFKKSGSVWYNSVNKPVFGNGKFLKFFEYRDSSSDPVRLYVYISRDGASWTYSGRYWQCAQSTTTGAYYNVNGLTFLNNEFIIYGAYVYVASNSTTTTTPVVICSYDGINWTQRYLSGATGTVTSILYEDGKYIYGTTSGQVLTSTKHTDVSVAAQVTTNKSLYLTHYNGKVVAVTSNALVYTADISDLTTWSEPSEIATDVEMVGVLSNGTSILIAYGDCPIYYSTDSGASWTEALSSETGSAISAAFYGGSYVSGLSDYKYFIYSDTLTYMSKDGKTWYKYSDIDAVEGVMYDRNTLLIATEGSVYRDYLYDESTVGEVQLDNIINYLIHAVDYLMANKADK